MTDEKPATTNGQVTAVRATSLIMTILAVIAGIWAMMGPLNQSVGSLKDEIIALRQELDQHEDTHAHPGATSDIAEVRVMFQDVNTRLVGMQALYDQRLGEVEAEIAKALDWILTKQASIASLEERVRALERVHFEHFGEPDE